MNLTTYNPVNLE